MDNAVTTVDRFITEEERRHPEATGAFSNVLYDLCLAAKVISREVNKAGLLDILGGTGRTNVQGEEVQKLDEYAHDLMCDTMCRSGHLCLMASEEEDEPIRIPDRYPTGPYVLLFDPLDGSSNIDANISIGTIFSLHRRVSEGRDGTLADLLQPGSRQIAAGYVLYGSSTMLVFTTGTGVHGFTLDPSIGEFLLSHPDIRIPSPGKKIYSTNEGYFTKWSAAQRDFVRHLRGDREAGSGFSSRYVGSLVADFHRTLLYGGLFMYPATSAHPNGKLRLMYEVAPMSLICREAGGAATDGQRDTLEIQPEELHQRVPFYVGNREYVELAGEYLAAE